MQTQKFMSLYFDLGSNFISSERFLIKSQIEQRTSAVRKVLSCSIIYVQLRKLRELKAVNIKLRGACVVWCVCSVVYVCWHVCGVCGMCHVCGVSACMLCGA